MNLPFPKASEIHKMVAPYQKPQVSKSAWQLVNSIVPYLALWALMVWSLAVSYWLTLLLAILAAGFLVRIFIIFHDCCHSSFFKSLKANEITGIITGLFVYTPFHQWKRDHSIHHATAGDLDRRGVGDVKTMTVKEFMTAPWLKKFGYTVMRTPLILFTVGSLLTFVVGHRFYSSESGPRERKGVLATNLALAGLIALLSWLIGFKEFLAVQVPILFVACSAGVWLFYVQHNFEGTYWERHDNWDFAAAGLKGSSFYKLPKTLQWFTGNIGFHHIHHLSPKIPNYLLEKCHKENPVFQQVTPLTFRRSLKSLFYRFWDEEKQCMVGWEALGK